MRRLLKAISVTDFRSLTGVVAVPLNAPVVLIHGGNGVGKTSVLTALEIGLTGASANLGRISPNYWRHLVRQGKSRAQIAVTVSSEVGDAVADITISPEGLKGTPAFDAADARFFSERCYLSQSALSRLLELYDSAPLKGDSALTKFVKDLLGLDALDAIVNGLHVAADKRRARKQLSGYSGVEDDASDAQTLSVQADDRVRAINTQLASRHLRLKDLLKELAIEESADWSHVFAELRKQLEVDDLATIRRLRRQTSDIESAWRDISVSKPELRNIEHDLRVTNESLLTWERSAGTSIEEVWNKTVSLVPRVAPLTDGPLLGELDRLKKVVNDESRACSSSLQRHRVAASRLAEVREIISAESARVDMVDASGIDLAAGFAGLSRALASITPHIQGEICPVCDRDFRETAGLSLTNHLTQKIAKLTENAGRLEAMARDRSEAQARLLRARSDEISLAGGILQPDEVGRLEQRLEQLASVVLSLEALRNNAGAMEQVWLRRSSLNRELAQITNRESRIRDVRSNLSTVLAECALDGFSELEPVDNAIRRLMSWLDGRESLLLKQQATRAIAVNEAEAVKADSEALRLATEKRDQARLAATIAASKFSRVESIRKNAKDLRDTALVVRGDIVRRVFSSTLNSLWRNLFVRLAPNEAFVPQFQIPSEGELSVAAVLETVHKTGARGGPPLLMHSAGNLNTAALTLFLALHLSVRENLPWLVFDDPVQSMDEVHVVQFAALLRSITKEHHKQVIVAVHDRALFEYLTLELSPAFAEDRLITVELGQAANGNTLVNAKTITFHPDAIAVA